MLYYLPTNSSLSQNRDSIVVLIQALRMSSTNLPRKCVMIAYVKLLLLYYFVSIYILKMLLLLPLSITLIFIIGVFSTILLFFFLYFCFSPRRSGKQLYGVILNQPPPPISNGRWEINHNIFHYVTCRETTTLR